MRFHFSSRAVLLATALFAVASLGSAQPSPTPNILEGQPLEPLGTPSGRTQWAEFSKAIQSRSAIAAVGTDGFGEQVNLYNGALAFSITDISIPGNSALPVELKRTYAVRDRSDMVDDLPMGDWDLDLPRISGVYGNVAPSFGWPSTRCSNATPPTYYLGNASTYTPLDYWQGLQAEMPGGGEMLVPAAGTPKPTSGGPYNWVTPSHTYFKCLSSIQNAVGVYGGEGFEAITADGIKYRFDWMAQYHEEAMASPKTDTANPIGLNRRRNVLYATYVEDRFGNSVTYTYVNAPNAAVRLQSITASDGRSITIAPYTSSGLITAASSHGRTWTYGYGAGSSNGRSLSSVALPDLSRWEIRFAPLTWAHIEYSGDQPGSCDHFRPLVETPAPLVGRVTHPAGATAEFAVAPKRHGRSNVPKFCINWERTGPNNPRNDVPVYVRDYWAFTLLKKTVTGPALPAMEWNYSYRPRLTWVPAHTVEGYVPVCETKGCANPVCVTEACALESTAHTTVIGPNNDWQRFTFGSNYRYDEGLLRKVERGSAETSVLNSEETTYNLALTNQNYANPIGFSQRFNGDAFTSEFLRPRIGTSITRDSSTFNWIAPASNFDLFARPTSVTRSSSLGNSRNEQIYYRDNTSKWVLGQVSTISVNDPQLGFTMPLSITFDPVTELPVERREFGKLVQRTTYHTGTVQGGLPWQVFDGGNINATTFTDYKRGLPTRVQFADTTALTAQINDRGEMDWATDQLGSKTCYLYDDVGRLITITPPSETTVGSCDNSAWAPTSIVYDRIPVAEYGIDGTHWRRTETTGTAVNTTYYDGLWRPLLERQSSNAGLRAATWRTFDHENRETLVSYPTDTDSNLSATHPGISTQYDAIGRTTRVSHASELSALDTVYSYLPLFRMAVIDPQNRSTITSFQAFDTPDTSNPTLVSQPEGVTTWIQRDVFGKPTSMTRSGHFDGVSQLTTHSFVYDSHQRLCKRIEPESGVTVFEYDTANRISWSAEGQSLTGLTCDRSNANVSDRIHRTYDNLDRLTAVDYPGTTVDKYFEYEVDGMLKRAYTGIWNPSDSSSVADWLYSWNKRRLLTREELVMGTGPFGKRKKYDYQYNSLGHRSTMGFHDGSSVNYAPNAFGQPTQVGTYASGVQYFADGSVKQFTYGNGITRVNTQQQGRPLLKRSQDTRANGTVVHDFEYVFDRSSNVQTITDRGNNGLQTRTLGYDGLNRLTSAHAPSLWGSANYRYDPLDNLRHADQGSRQHRYFYDGNARLGSIRTPSGSTVWSFAYDSRGNQTARGSQTYTFDRANRLISIPGLISGYYYDAHGRRVGEIRSNGFAQYSLYTSDGTLRGNSDSSAVQSVYIHLGNQLIATRKTDYDNLTQITYHHTDMLGSPVVESNAQGIPQSPTYYAPYGEPMNRAVDGPGYTGHQMDAPTGLTYMQQRYYDPVVGRFLSVDPMAADTTTGWNFNRFSYANNNPYRFVDPDGRETLAIRAMERDFESYERGDMSREELDANNAARAGGVVVGAAILAGARSPAAIRALGSMFSRRQSNDLPKNPSNLSKQGYKETSHPAAAQKGHRTFENAKTGDKLRHDQGKPGRPGHEGRDHYHRENPNATGKQDQYLDKSGNPVPRGSDASHLYPKEKP
ncbi:MAG: RHS repeat-associated core domain-containing protein [Pseudomarimonas sp.]